MVAPPGLQGPEIEMTPMPSGAQLGSSFSPDEPAKVHVAAVGEDFKSLEAARDVEKECLYAENAALKECLLQQQQQQQSNMNWLWQMPNEWCQSGEQQWNGDMSEAIIQPGAEVAFQGLQKAQDLNGVHAVVDRWDESSKRWVVRLASGEEKFAKPTNLILAYPSWPGYCNYGWQGYGDSYEVPQTGRGKKPEGAPERKRSSLSSASPRNSTSSFVSDTTASGLTTASFTSCSSWEGNEEMKTTVMMRNLPNDYTREMLLKLLDQEGFNGCYDLVYLPIDYHSKVGFGYAFINLVSHSEAERFRTYFTDFAKWDVVSQKVCEVCWSSVLQGVQAHVDRYRNSPVMHEAVRDEFKPVLFENGKRVPFPGPTKSIRAPRARRRDAK